MATRTFVEYIDDLDGTAAGDIEPVEFGLDGVTYEIDLSAANAATLRAFMATYIEAARRPGRRRNSPIPGAIRPARSPDQTKAIREWALNNGYSVSLRGRVSAVVVAAYEAAHAVRTAASGTARAHERTPVTLRVVSATDDRN